MQELQVSELPLCFCSLRYEQEAYHLSRRRLRRIKCGEERPLCARCVKSGLECAYDPDSDSSHGTGSFLTFSMRPNESGQPSETVAGYVPPGLKRKIEAQALRTQRKPRPTYKR